MRSRLTRAIRAARRSWRRQLERARYSASLSGSDPNAAFAAAAEAAIDPSLVRSMRVGIRLAMGYFTAEPPEGMPDLLAKVIMGKPPSRDELATMVGRLLSLDHPLPEEVADVMYALLKAAMGRGCGDPGDMKELLVSAACAWSDNERQQYMRGMLDVLKQQNRARRQTGGIGPAASGPLPTVGEMPTARLDGNTGAYDVFVDAPGDEAEATAAARSPSGALRRRA